MRKFLTAIGFILAATFFYGFIYLGMVIGCALDDQCFEENTGYSAKDPRFAPRSIGR